jgi:hypothetical protein
MDDVTPDDPIPDDSILEPVKRLSRDLRRAALTLGDAEARFLVDAYYLMQDDRKRAYAQEHALGDNAEPNAVIQWLAVQSATLESQIKGALDIYTRHHEVGDFMRSIYGIGPVISAGLLAHIYMGDWCQVCRARTTDECSERQKSGKKIAEHKFTLVEACPTAGHIFQFAGLAGDGQKPWEKGTKRPFNAQLKVLSWKAGQSFLKFSNQPECIYGHHYREQKAKYIARNEVSEYSLRALGRAPKVGKGTEAYKHYSTGKLPPGHIDAMARRWAVKRFLADLHIAWYWTHYRRLPPLPYPVAILKHAHYDYSALQGIPELWEALRKQ